MTTGRILLVIGLTTALVTCVRPRSQAVQTNLGTPAVRAEVESAGRSLWRAMRAADTRALRRLVPDQALRSVLLQDAPAEIDSGTVSLERLSPFEGSPGQVLAVFAVPGPPCMKPVRGTSEPPLMGLILERRTRWIVVGIWDVQGECAPRPNGSW